MRYTIGTRNAPCTLEIKVRALKPMALRVQAYDHKQPNTFLTDRIEEAKPGVTSTFFVQMPLSPNICGVAIYDAVQKGETDSGFSVLSIKKKSLRRKLDVAGLSDLRTRNFVRFAERFSFNAGWLPSNNDDQVYCSDANIFQIRYLPILTYEGKEVTTPARVNKYTKITECSKAKYVPMTVPERFCILCHEYAHLNMNENAADEEEADLNGLTIYLSLGYPRPEARKIFGKTFSQTKTPMNDERYRHIESFITEFDKYFYDR